MKEVKLFHLEDYDDEIDDEEWGVVEKALAKLLNDGWEIKAALAVATLSGSTIVLVRER